MRNLVKSIIIILIFSFVAAATETTWRHPGFEVAQYDINFTSVFNISELRVLEWGLNTSTPSVSEANRAKMYYDNNQKRIMQSIDGGTYEATATNLTVNFYSGNASNITTGTLADARLSQNFTIQQGKESPEADGATAVGYRTLASQISSAYWNTAFGDIVLSNATTGSYNTGVGRGVLSRLISGSGNAGTGANALYFTTYGNDNTAVGQDALYRNINGSSNVAVGSDCLQANTNGTSNVCVGNRALYTYNQITTQTDSNVAVGDNAMYSTTTGRQNVAIGGLAGETTNPANANKNGSRNVWIGYNAGKVGTTQLYDTVAIGESATAMYNNTWTIGKDRSIQAIREITNGALGTATLVSGSVVVPNTNITVNTRIFLTINTPGGTPGAVYVGGRNAGVNFYINSTSASDTSTVAYLLIEGGNP